jgi:hypothetical protein
MDRGKDRDDANEALTAVLAAAAADRNNIPQKLPDDLNSVSDLDDIHEEALEKQSALDMVLMSNLRQLTATYILGLEKQIERMDAELEVKPIGLIRDEITKSRDDANHFPYLMLGIAPEPEDENKDPDGATEKAPDNG